MLRHGSLDDEVEFGHAVGTQRPGTRRTEVDGRTIRCRVTGTGAPLVLLHGIGRSLDDWDEQHERLSGQYQVISLDLPGFGWSDPLPRPASVRGLADAVAALLEELGVDGPVQLVGNSLGGAVAMRFAADRPQQVRALVLADAAGFGAEVAVALRVLAIRPLGRLLLRPRRSAAIDTLRGCFRDRSFITPQRIDATLALASRPHSATTMLQLLRELGTVRGIRPGWRRDLLARLAPLRIPTLVLWGDKDLILPPSHLEAAREALPHSRFHLFPDTGHFPQIERADEFATLVGNFLTDHRAQPELQETS
ncbi:alpha/beta fold hydrolase [Nakamurella sp. A5-74]|uniref:Alpha/beta fold hydrolase n=1 Tax=Nakamurella sp. A5-74 TaxID=3158264 RepID=A0AAU8DUB2_9ACTN